MRRTRSGEFVELTVGELESEGPCWEKMRPEARYIVFSGGGVRGAEKCSGMAGEMVKSFGIGIFASSLCYLLHL